MRPALTVFAFAIVATGVLTTCGIAARRVLLLLCALVGLPLGLALDLNECDGAAYLWWLSGAVAALCLGLTDELQIKEPDRNEAR